MTEPDRIPADVVKRLRDETGAGMMDCKKALVESGGDLDRARQILRERGKRALRAGGGPDLLPDRSAPAASLAQRVAPHRPSPDHGPFSRQTRSPRQRPLVVQFGKEFAMKLIAST